MNGQNQITLDFEAPSMTPPEHIVWSALKYRLGKESAVLGPALAECAGITYTEVRSIIAHLVNDHGMLIASCGRGYYVPQTPEEISEATKSLRHRGIMILLRASRLQKTSIDAVYGQGKLELDKAS